MADSVSLKWDRGNVTVPGTASKGYPFVDYDWNTGSGTSHDLLLSPVIDFPLEGYRGGKSVSILVNTEAMDSGTSANVVVNIYGSATNDECGVCNGGGKTEACSSLGLSYSDNSNDIGMCCD